MSQDEKIDLQSLIQKWYARLADEGFEDIEQDGTFLKRWHSIYFHLRHTPQEFELKQSYYRKAGLFLHEYCFQTSEQKAVWHLHSEGYSYKEIASKLRSRFKTSNKDRVQKIVGHLREIMREHLLDD